MLQRSSVNSVTILLYRPSSFALSLILHYYNQYLILQALHSTETCSHSFLGQVKLLPMAYDKEARIIELPESDIHGQSRSKKVNYFKWQAKTAIICISARTVLLFAYASCITQATALDQKEISLIGAYAFLIMETMFFRESNASSLELVLTAQQSIDYIPSTSNPSSIVPKRGYGHAYGLRASRSRQWMS